MAQWMPKALEEIEMGASLDPVQYARGKTLIEEQSPSNSLERQDKKERMVVED